MKSAKWLYLALALAAFGWLGSRFFGSEEARIRARLEAVRVLVEKEAGEGALAAVSRADDLIGFLTPQFEIEIVPIGERMGDPQQLQRVFVGYRHNAETLAVAFSDLSVEVAPDGRSARTTCTATLNGGLGGFAGGDRYALELQWRKEGSWKISRALVDLPPA